MCAEFGDSVASHAAPVSYDTRVSFETRFADPGTIA